MGDWMRVAGRAWGEGVRCGRIGGLEGDWSGEVGCGGSERVGADRVAVLCAVWCPAAGLAAVLKEWAGARTGGGRA